MDKIVSATKGVEASVPVAGAAPAAPRYLSGRPRSKTIDLVEPFELLGVEYHRITARRLVGRELMDLQGQLNSGISPEMVVFAAMCDVPPLVIISLDAVDFARLASEAKDFMPQLVSAANAPTGGNGEGTPQT
jgi:hypothetical protein